VRSRVVADTGPLVAATNRADAHHAWALACVRDITAPMFTCEAVLAEACHLLRGCPGAADRLLAWIDRGALRVEYALAADLDSVRERMRKFADLPMSLADACVVGIAESQRRSTIWTVDSDFLIYRRRDGRKLSVWMPEQAHRPSKPPPTRV
jgi:predicted nucleic acid-binding protein